MPIKYIRCENKQMTDRKASKITIAIIEDIKEVANGLKGVLNNQEDMTCERVYYDAESAISFISQFPVDIVLTDIGLPSSSGIDAIISIKKVCPNTQFCMFTVFEDNDKIFKSLEAGARGYILKNSNTDSIVRAIRELHHGGSPMNPIIARKVIDSFSTPKVNKTISLPLTDRETELLGLLAKGLLYKEIAQKLDITLGTVKQHIHKIYQKLEVNNRTEAINLYNNVK